MGKLGFDINLHDLSPEELSYCKQSVKDYNSLKPVILDGDQYRLVSPHSGNHAATAFVSKNRDKCVLFAFDVYPRYDEKLTDVRLKGLDPSAIYRVEEINRFDGSKGEVKTYSGDYLMKVGIPVFSTGKLSSRVYLLTKV